MKRIMILAWCGLGLLSAQTFNFSSLDKLAAKAASANEVNMTGDQLRAALALMPAEKRNQEKFAKLKELVNGITSLSVRNFEFCKQGQYSDADLQPIRQQFAAAKGWSKIVDSKEKSGEHSQVFLLTESGKVAGLAVLAAEQSELSVVVLKGTADLASLGMLGGLASLPSMQLKPVATAAK